MQRKTIINLITTVLLWFTCSTSLFAQPKPATFLPVAPEVLSNSLVRCFFKDSKGYMWMGTAEGLMRYDGTTVTRYEHNPNDRTSIPHNLVNVIAEDQKKNLWIGTARGLMMYDRQLDHFINIDSIPGSVNYLNNRFITALAFDQQGKFWIGTHGDGINLYDPTTRTFQYLSKQQDNGGARYSQFITDLTCDDDLIWCGTKQGVELYDATASKRASLECMGVSGVMSEVTKIVRDYAGNIWLASAEGSISKLTKGNGYYSCSTILSGQARYGASWNGILAFTLDKKGNFWIGGENAGLAYLDTHTGTVTRFFNEKEKWGNLPTNNILSVFVDNTGLTWIGTVNQGAFLIDHHTAQFNLYHAPTIAAKVIRGIAQDRSGKIWLAIEDVGLATLDLKTGELKPNSAFNAKAPNKFFTSMICDRGGNLWIGTAGDGVYKLNTENGSVLRFDVKSGGLGDNKLYCLYEDKSGKIWAGSAGSGLFYFDARKNTFSVLAEKSKASYVPGTTYVSSITDDSQGELWVGTLYGVYALKRNADSDSYEYSWHGHEGPGTLGSNGIQTIFEDQRKNLWIATSDNGLNVRWNGRKDFETFNTNDGLVSNTIRALTTDSRGNLWISTNKGLSRFDLSTKTFTNYSRTDGLTSNNFCENAVLRSNQGAILFGSNNGFNSFYPDSLHSDRSSPVVYLTDLKINNRSATIGATGSPLTQHISLSSSIDLGHDQRSFTVDFAAINFARSARYRYCYMLEGFDADWNCAGASQSATYTNIDPGQYVFMVKASNGDGVWSETPTRLVITIAPAPWLTWWALTAYCLIAAGMGYAFFHFRMERVRMQVQLHSERVAHERERDLIQSKTLFFTNVSHEFRTPLSLILLPLETLIASAHVPAAVKSKIKIAHKSAERMMNLVNELMDFNKAESGTLKLHVTEGDVLGLVREISDSFYDLAARRNIRFSLRSEVKSLRGLYDSGKLEKIIFNLLSNAFKFTRDGGEISVEVREKDIAIVDGSLPCRCLELIVIDNGIGIDACEIPRIFDKFYQAKSATKITNPGTGIGLSLTRALVELHGGKINAISADGLTRFTVALPVEQLPGVIVDASAAVNNEPEQKNETCGQAEILLVEDNVELRRYLAAELRGEFTVLESANGAEGIAIAREKVPDLIISDILMETKSGLELCKTLKADVKTSHIPVILLTAKASVEEQIIGIESGADLYITKPFNYQYLLTHVRNIVRSRQTLYARFSNDVYLLPAKAATNEIDQAFLQRVIDHIVDHIQDSQLGVDSIASLLNLSRVQVYRKIKALTGKAVVELIRSVRLKQALKLMETKQFTLSEVAYQAGFNSASYFTRSFKEEYGKTPSEFMELSGSISR